MPRTKPPARPIDAVPADLSELLDTEDPPSWLAPMKATLTEDRFSDPNWLFEPKLDGYRCLAFHSNGELRMLSRNQLRQDQDYPQIAEQLRAQRVDDFVIDGEIVAIAGDRPDFGLLQRARSESVPLLLYVFDLLHLDGCSTRQLPLHARKELLADTIEFGDVVRLTPHRDEDGLGLFAEMCERGWEGVIAKRADSRYQSRRSGDWLKFKCSMRQELVVGGFTDPQNSRAGFGALLVGYHDDDGRLVYAGKVGTGYRQDLLVELRGRLDKLERATSPFAVGAPPKLRSHWVRPRLVAEVAFSEWTTDGKLRHPRFLGLRTDKTAADVVRESKP